MSVEMEEQTEEDVHVQSPYIQQWHSTFQQLHRRARAAQSIIYEEEGWTAAYKKGDGIIQRVQQVMNCLDDIYFYSLSGELAVEWTQNHLMYQKAQIV